MQIVGYETGASDGGAALHVVTDGALTHRSLERGAELSFPLGDRHCAGAVTASGHESCDRQSAPYCEEHSTHWPCARCTGNCTMPTDACHEEHAVYLAAFAPSTVKVGVTRSWRLETRLREQGADRGAHIRTVENGRLARGIEAEIAERFPDRVRVPTKIESLHRTVDDDVWSAVLAEFDTLDTFDFDYEFTLHSRPVRETLATGRVIGTKGRVLVLDRGGTTYAVDLRELVGHEVETEPDRRTRQTSFGAFE